MIARPRPRAPRNAPTHLGPSVTARITRARPRAVRSLIRQRLKAVQYCAQRTAVGSDLGRTGRLRITGLILSNGQVVSPKVAFSSLRPETDACVRASVRRWSFPAMREGQTIAFDVTMQLVFRSGLLPRPGWGITRLAG